MIKIGIGLPPDFMRQFRVALDGSINVVIEALYKKELVPRDFIFTKNVRDQTRERMLEILLDYSITSALDNFGDLAKALEEMWNLLTLVYHKCEGYLLAYYDFTKGK